MTIIEDQIYFLRLLSRVDSKLKISLTGQSRWIDPFYVIRNPPVKPIVARSILRNELVLEIDDDNWEIVRDGSRAITNQFEKWGAPYYLSFSGNRSIHTHILFNAYKIDISQDTRQILANVEKDEVRKALKEYIMRQVKIATDTNIDMNLIGKHLIRMEGSVNEKSGRFCTQISSIPDEKPLKYEVKVPDSLPTFWEISFMGKDLETYLKFHFTKKEARAFPLNFSQLDQPERLVNILKPIYIPNYRHYIVFSLSGIFKKHGIEYKEALRLIKELSSPDLTPMKTAYIVKEVYRVSDPRKTPGITRLREVIDQEVNDNKITSKDAEDVLSKLREALKRSTN